MASTVPQIVVVWVNRELNDGSVNSPLHSDWRVFFCLLSELYLMNGSLQTITIYCGYTMNNIHQLNNEMNNEQ